MSDAENLDCFLSHSRRDQPAVLALAKALRERGISVWLDEERLRPGAPSQQLREAGLRAARSIAVLVGTSGLGPWEEEEMRAALSLAVEEQRPVIPVLLPDAPTEPDLPLFLRGRTWVDMRAEPAPGNRSALDQLIWGITGERPEHSAPLPAPRVIGQDRSGSDLRNDDHGRPRPRWPLLLLPLLLVLGLGLGLVLTRVIVGGQPLAGTILDGAGRPIPGARVAIPELGLDTHTDALGYFSLQVPGHEPRQVQLIATAPDLAPHRQFVLSGARGLSFTLRPD